MQKFQLDFIRFALDQKILSFGDFTLKSGVKSPYFFNFGLLNHGYALHTLSQFYTQAMMHHKIDCDVIYGPAYKGIPIASGAASNYFEMTQKSLGFSYRRKEAKDHGEGGQWVGACMKNKRVLIMDDVVAQGTAMKESVQHLQAIEGIEIVGLLVALDRQDIGYDQKTHASNLLRNDLNLPVYAGVLFNDLLTFVHANPDYLSLEQWSIFNKNHA